MECNKDEAIRTMELAEKKMENTDFEGARKMALKARKLYPELENINRMLSTCDVHCSAQKRILGSEKDWYEILQVEKFADALMVKKQYRRLALILHPDKNQLPGAEGAFKLICEANMILSDPVKKSRYDGKLKASAIASAPANPNLDKNPPVNKQYSAGINTSNDYSTMNQHQAAKSNFSSGMGVFWTCCPYCKMRYQYPRQFVRRSISCPDCRKTFVAHEVAVPDNFSRTKSSTQGSVQNVHSRPDLGRPAAFHERKGIQRDKGPPASQDQLGAAAGRENVKPEPAVQNGTCSEDIKVDGATNNVEISKTNETDNKNSSSLHHAEEVGTANDDASSKETRDPKNKSRKRARKESSESCDASTGSDLKNMNNEGSASDVATASKFESVQVRPPRRSSRKQHISYNETEVDDLTDPPLNTPQAVKVDNTSKKPKNGHDSSSLGDASCHPKVILQDEKLKAGGEMHGKSSNGFDAVEIASDWDEDTLSSDISNIECPDPEFSDFDKAREESQFEVGQFWACYDWLDDMPRFYAKVKKVSFSPFELSITWLEAVPIHELYNEWVDEELPIGCGSFKLCLTEKAERLSFSHQVHVEKGKKRGSLLLYPREGEVWAIFKEWDISWSTDPNNHKKNFKYEIVEVLSDFLAGNGIKVVYLDKISGFVSLFQRACQGEKGSFVIGPNELYRFSHCIPCFKMTGLEREGVPKGSFELDPASLPLNPDHLFYPGKGKMVHGKGGSGVQCSTLKLVEEMGKSMLCEATASKTKNYVDLEEMDGQKV